MQDVINYQKPTENQLQTTTDEEPTIVGNSNNTDTDIDDQLNKLAEIIISQLLNELE
jgi:hypothetical protein